MVDSGQPEDPRIARLEADKAHLEAQFMREHERAERYAAASREAVHDLRRGVALLRDGVALLHAVALMDELLIVQDGPYGCEAPDDSAAAAVDESVRRGSYAEHAAEFPETAP